MAAKLKELSAQAQRILREGTLVNSPILELLKTMEEFHTLRQQIDDLTYETAFLADRLTGKTRTQIPEQKQAIGERTAVLHYTNTAWLKHLLRIEAILQRGYDPGMPPDAWHLGYLQQPRWWTKEWTDQGGQNVRIFRQTIPDWVEERYRAARTAKVYGMQLFDRIIVASPRVEDFRAPLDLCDPGIWGLIPRDPEIQLCVKTSPRVIENAIGFRIAMWDFEKDRARAGL